MSIDEIEELIRKYLSTGIAVVVILVAPGTGRGSALPEVPGVVTIEPGPSGANSRTTEPPTCGTDPRTTDHPSDKAGSGGGEPTARHLPGISRPTADDPDENSGSDNPDSDQSGSPPSDHTGASGTDPDSASSDRPRGTGGGSGTGTGGGTGGGGSSSGGSSGSDSSGTGTGTGGGTENCAREPGSGSSDNRSDNQSDNQSGERPGNSSGTGDAAGNRDTGGDPTDSGSGNDDSRPGSGSGSGTGSGTAGSGSTQSSDNGATAAEKYGWGTPNREDDFSGGTDQWDIYDGPGHGGNGTRSPSAVSLNDGILTITGDSSGTTAGMAWNPGQKYGRWEGRVKAPASDESYNALFLLWPDAEDWPEGGEVDFMEMMDNTRQKTNFFLHYGADNSQVSGSVEIDATEWHNWAVEWTPEAITAYVDGKEWYRTTDQSILPPGPMHMTIQLDWFPQGDNPKESTMMVDWVRQYSLDGSGSGSGDPGNGDPGNGDGTLGSDAATSDANGSDTTSSTDNSQNGADAPIGDAIRRMFSWR